jgi:hypothetical protein
MRRGMVSEEKGSSDTLPRVRAHLLGLFFRRLLLRVRLLVLRVCLVLDVRL